MKKTIIGILSLILIYTIHLNFGYAIEKKLKDITYIIVDGFEIEGEWISRYSKFRSRSWDPESKERDSNKSWMKWLVSDDSKPNYERKYLVPAQVYKSAVLKDEKTILSIRGSWDRRGRNWITIEPSNRRLSKQQIGTENPLTNVAYKNDKLSRNYILLPGRTKILYTFLWGMGYNYKVEVHVQDYLGNFYVIPGTYLNYFGWRNITFKIPKYVKQDNRILPRIRPLKFIKYKIISSVEELNTGFYTYLDYMHIRTDIYEKSFFGSRLRRTEQIYWSNDNNKSGKPKPKP